MKYIKVALIAAFLASTPLYPHNKIVQGCNTFAVNMYKQLTHESQENIFFSPYSIANALSVAYAGARGTTEREMAHVLCADNLSQDVYHTHFVDLMNTINQSNPNYTLEIANKLFVADWLTITDSFKKRLQPYGAPFETINFCNASKTSNTINSWVENKTHEKIQNIVSPDMFSVDTCLAIANAIYFKGAWVKPFKESLTIKKPFYINSDKNIRVDMMQQTDTFNYTENDLFKMIELPYKGNRLSMFVMLPQDAHTIDSLEHTIDRASLDNAIEQLKAERINVKLPKFKIETEYSLNSILQQLGMASAFMSFPCEANFSGIAKNADPYISNVIHKAFINTDEYGTEAAAATVVLMEARCMHLYDIENPIVFNANKPFVFFIQDKLTKTILFMGKMNNPNT